jgi:hypothetical protein
VRVQYEATISGRGPSPYSTSRPVMLALAMYVHMLHFSLDMPVLERPVYKPRSSSSPKT